MNENENIIEITENENRIKIEIKENCSLIYFYNEISNKLTKNRMNQINMNSILEENKIVKKCLYILKEGNKIYNIATNGKKDSNKVSFLSVYNDTYISEKTFENNCIHETTLKLLPHENYSISIMIHNKDTASKSVNTYNKKENNIVTSLCKLHKRPALKEARLLLNNLNNIADITSIIPLNDIYNYLNLIPEKKYCPIITDNTLTLSWKNKDNKNDMNKEFDIILNKTMEIIGDISFDYSEKKNFNYEKNVSCNIKPEYRNKHFASKSLKLLKEIVQKSQYNNNKNSYITRTENNNIYQKKITNR